MITTAFTLVGVVVGVSVGTGVAVGDGRVGDGMGVDVGSGVTEAVRVGNGVGTKLVEVGSGVKVGKSKLNNGVGDGCVPSVGRDTGLVGTPREARAQKSESGNRHRQQIPSNATPGRKILPDGPNWR